MVVEARVSLAWMVAIVPTYLKHVHGEIGRFDFLLAELGMVQLILFVWVVVSLDAAALEVVAPTQMYQHVQHLGVVLAFATENDYFSQLGLANGQLILNRK